MKIMKKIKDILFDEEEVEIPVIEKTKEKPKQKAKPMKTTPIIDYEEEKNSIKEVKMPDDDLTDKDNLKSELTFPFPIEFDEDEIEQPTPKVSSSVRHDVGRSHNDVSRINRDRDNYRKYESNSPVSKSREIKDYSSYLRDKEEKKQFKPTPIISPVYGVLDQNYKKEDLVVKNEVRRKTNNKGKPNLDEIRKKAYGEAIEEKIIPEEKVEVIDLDEPIIDPKTPIGDLIEQEESIKMPKMGNIKEEPTIELNELMDEKDKIEKKLEDEIEDDDTDLFSLIDSMYEENNE